MRLICTTIAASFLAGSALAQPLPAPASYPLVIGEKGVVTTHALSMQIADEIAHAAQFIVENDFFSGRCLDLDGGLRL